LLAGTVVTREIRHPVSLLDSKDEVPREKRSSRINKSGRGEVNKCQRLSRSLAFDGAWLNGVAGAAAVQIGPIDTPRRIRSLGMHVKVFGEAFFLPHPNSPSPSTFLESKLLCLSSKSHIS
jgi:hypothetical protein